MWSALPRSSDLDFVQRHRSIWAARPELRSVYQEFFAELLRVVEGRTPIVELGAGPGFFKEYYSGLISTDVISTPWVDVVCDACALPFRSKSVGALVMLDVLHHLPCPLDFMAEAARVLVPGGLIAMIEPWITPFSYLLYRYFHHEECTLRMDLRRPFEACRKNAFDGNATIPYKLVEHYHREPGALRLAREQRFLGLPYLVTFGFKRTRPLPVRLISAARFCERLLGPLGRWNATRALLVWQKAL
ncbi:MAG TPA: class I SAM-dependent methyltransferase [Terriglobia bacterium]|nr:class I SAM-dependent methyltransferase [Terriglobia bacterium]